MAIGPFNPAGTVAGTIAVTSTSQRIAFSTVMGSSVYLANVGTKECFIAFGDVTITATAGGAATAASDGSMSIPSGFYGVVATQHQSNLAAVCAGADTTTLRIMVGTGE